MPLGKPLLVVDALSAAPHSINAEHTVGAGLVEPSPTIAPSVNVEAVVVPKRMEVSTAIPPTVNTNITYIVAIISTAPNLDGARIKDSDSKAVNVVRVVLAHSISWLTLRRTLKWGVLIC